MPVVLTDQKRGSKVVNCQGNQNSFLPGVLRFLSSLRLEVFGSAQIQTVFYAMLQYGTV